MWDVPKWKTLILDYLFGKAPGIDMKVINNRLVRYDGTPVKYVQTPNTSGVIVPKYLVIHYGANSSKDNLVKTLTSKIAKVSAQLVIGRDGEVVELADLNAKCWHAGQSEWKNLKGMNAYTIGIELDNYGRLIKTADGGWITYFGKKVDPSEVIVAKHKLGGPMSGWHTYTEAQLDSLEEVGLALFDHYKLEDVLGHEDIAPGRKSDPGPAFPMVSFRSKMHGRESEDGLT